MIDQLDFTIQYSRHERILEPGKIGRARSLSAVEMGRFFQHVLSDRDRLIFAIAYFTGSRMGEVVALRVEDIDLINNRIIFRSINNKSRKGRYVTITDTMRVFIDAYDMPTDTSAYVFPSRHNARVPGHLTMQAISNIIKAIIADVPEFAGVRSHTFRRSFATDLNRQGFSKDEIARGLGHDLTVTDRYID